jgi:hypothetical protein
MGAAAVPGKFLLELGNLFALCKHAGHQHIRYSRYFILANYRPRYRYLHASRPF